MPRTVPGSRQHDERPVAEHVPALLLVSPDSRVALGDLLDTGLGLGGRRADVRPEAALLQPVQRPTPDPHGHARRHAGGIAAVVPVEVGNEHAAERGALGGQGGGEPAVDDGRRALEAHEDGRVEARREVGARAQVLPVSYLWGIGKLTQR